MQTDDFGVPPFTPDYIVYNKEGNEVFLGDVHGQESILWEYSCIEKLKKEWPTLPNIDYLEWRKIVEEC